MSARSLHVHINLTNVTLLDKDPQDKIIYISYLLKSNTSNKCRKSSDKEITLELLKNSAVAQKLFTNEGRCQN